MPGGLGLTWRRATPCPISQTRTTVRPCCRPTPGRACCSAPRGAIRRLCLRSGRWA